MSNQEIVLDVMGMTCPSCIRHVDAALTEVEGVTKVVVRLRDGKVLVQYDPTVAKVEMMLEALRETGYEAKPSVAA